MTGNDRGDAATGEKAETSDSAAEEKLKDPQVYEAFEEAMGDLSDAGGRCQPWRSCGLIAPVGESDVFRLCLP